jgi:tetratricopeptide (TPR) repeat protein
MLSGFALPALFVVVLAATNPSDDFERGRNAFFRGEYKRAIGLLNPLLYPELRLDSEEEVVQTHRMLGVAYLFEGQQDQARREFRKLLELSPDFQLDPYLESPRVVEFFQGVVREQRAELGDIEARLKKREAALAKKPAGGLIERRIERHSYAINFLPFGSGQFQNGNRKKGWLFLTTESALAVTSLAAFTVNFAAYGVRPYRGCLDPVVAQPDGSPGVCPDDRIDHSSENLSRNLTRVQVVSGGLFFATAIWGIVDAIRNFRAEVPLGDTYLPSEAAGPVPGRPSSSAAPTEGPRGGPTLTPRFSAGGPSGAMLSFSF